jgi:ABC-type amino acid transport substrate-binding protein
VLSSRIIFWFLQEKSMRFLATVILVLTLVPVSARTAEPASAYERVLKTGILRCAYASASPNVVKDLKTGKLTGPIPEIAEAMAETLSLKVEWVAEVGYADFAEGLASGRYDAFCGILAMAPFRARVAAFTSPIYYNPYYAYVRTDEKRFHVPEDANQPQFRAGMIDGEVYQMIERKRFPKAREVGLPNMTPHNQLFEDLAAGKSDIIVYDSLVYLEYAKNNPGKVQRAFDKPLEMYPVAFAVSPHETELRDMLNVAILSLNNLGKIDAIFNSYGADASMVYRVAAPYSVPK